MRFFFLILLFLATLSAQQNTFIIRSIVVEGNIRSDASSIRVNSGLFIGKEIASNDIQSAIRNLWEMGLFKKVDIYANEINQNNEVDILIKVIEYPRLNEFSFEGLDELDEDDLNPSSLPVFYKGMIITPYRLFKLSDDIKKQYEKEGYLLAEVTVDTLMSDENKVNLKIKINEGDEIEVERIRIIGISSLEEDDIIDEMETSTNGFLGFGGDFKSKEYIKDKEKVTKYIQNQGFRNGGFIRDSIYYNDKKDEMYIDIYIYEGDRFFFGNLKFKGNTVFSDDDLMNEIDYKVGAPYSDERFSKVGEKIKELYYNKGYLFTQLSPTEQIIEPDTIAINYEITERSIVRIREIHITGNTKTQDKVIQRALRIFPGNKFSQDKIQRSMADLGRLNYFEQVLPDVKPLDPFSDEEVDLQFNVKEKSTDQANASIGYSELDGLIGNIGLTFNNFSLSKPFQEGGGQQLSISTQFSKIQNVYSVSVMEPYFNNTNTILGGSFYYSRLRKREDDAIYTSYIPYNEDRFSVSFTVGRQLQWPDNYFRATFSVEFAQSELKDVDESYRNLYPVIASIENKKLFTTQFNFNLNRDSRNSQEFPTYGSLYNLNVEYNVGDKNFIKTLFDVQNFSPVFSKIIIYNNVKIGVMNNIKASNLYSPSDFYYMGGAGLVYGTESLRGYEDRTVGAHDVVVPNSSGTLVSRGGNAMFKMTNELRIQLIPNPTIFALLFHESGNVWKHPSDISFLDVSRSVGVGVRVFMPLVGIIGFDYGYGIDNFSDIFSAKKSPQWLFHFQFGRF